MHPVLVLLNPQAANGRAAALAEPMRSWLAEHAPQVGLIVSDSLERSRAQLQCLPRSSRAVVVGGDGTLHHLLPVLLSHRLTLGLVPLGQGNDTARAVGVAHLAWHDALALALDGPTRRMDVGELLAERLSVPFLSGLAAGFDAQVAQRARQAPERLAGAARYRWAALRELRGLHAPAMRVAIDGQTCHDGHGLSAAIFNTPTAGGGLPAMPAARIADGRLNLRLAAAPGRLGALARLLAGRAPAPPALPARAFESLRIDADTPLPISADGEAVTALPGFEVRLRASALAVVSPPSRRGDQALRAP